MPAPAPYCQRLCSGPAGEATTAGASGAGGTPGSVHKDVVEVDLPASGVLVSLHSAADEQAAWPPPVQHSLVLAWFSAPGHCRCIILPLYNTAILQYCRCGGPPEDASRLSGWPSRDPSGAPAVQA
jgi:hypothetical protein